MGRCAEMALRELVLTQTSEDGVLSTELYKNPNGSCYLWVNVGAVGFELPIENVPELVDLLVDTEIRMSLISLTKKENKNEQ